MMTPLVWLIVAIVLAVVEIATVGFFVMFFAMGALITAGAAFFLTDLPSQLAVFLISSVVLLVFARPLVKRTLNLNDQPSRQSNADSLPGEAVLVLEPVTRYTGRVKLLHSGEVWSAYLDPAHTEPEILAEVEAEVVAVDGAKLVIRAKEKRFTGTD